MRARHIRDRVADVAAAAQLLCDAQTLLDLAVEAVAAACPQGAALAFTRRGDGTHGPAATWVDGGTIPLRSLRSRGPVPWVVNLDRVPEWQQDSWIEPLHAGVHGLDYFSRTHPIRGLIGARMQPDYGRMMVCHDARMVAWVGVYIDARRGFRASEQTALAEVAAQLAMPLRVAAALDCDTPRIALAPRQYDIVSRVTLGWTNKRIALDLGISPATVKTILERLFRMSGAANRTALVEWWRRALRSD